MNKYIINKNENIIIHDLYMDNNTNNIKNNDILDESYNTVKDLYKDIGFMGQYGSDVFLCFVYLSIPVLVFLYFKTMKDSESIINDVIQLSFLLPVSLINPKI